MMTLFIEVATGTASSFPVSATLLLIVGFIAAASIGSWAWFKSNRVVGWKEGQGTSADSNEPGAGYDRGITPAEVASRQKREGGDFKNRPNLGNELDTAGGYTMSREGLLNNYAVEPEMYVEERGDLQEEKEAEAEERIQELQEVNETGGKGPGVV